MNIVKGCQFKQFCYSSELPSELCIKLNPENSKYNNTFVTRFN